MGMHIAVAGAGIIGSSIAWRLAQRGCRVTLFDKGTMGAEASWAGAGMLAPGGEVAGPSPWSEMAMASALAYPDFVRELTAASGLTVDYRPFGAVEIAAGDVEVADLAARVAQQGRLGIESRPVEPAELARLAPGAVIPPGGVARYFPGDAVVDPRDVTAALRLSCQRLGVTIRESTAIERVEWQGRQARVHLPGGEVVTVDGVVLAAGAWNSGIAVDFSAPATFPVRGHLLGYDLAPGLLPPIVRRGHTYLLQRSSGFFIAGASSEEVGFDRTIDPAIVEMLRANAERLFPPLRGQTPQAWIGFRPATAAYQPEIRRIEDTGIWLACGHYRNGILLAPETARRVAASIIGAT